MFDDNNTTKASQMAVVSYTLHENIAEIVLNNPPVNAINLEMRTSLIEFVRQADADPAVQAIVIRADGTTFPVGADVKEFGSAPIEPHLPDVCNVIELSTTPVIVGLHGNTLGGGLELALAAHYRIAAADTRLGLPEVKLGLLPGAGGTQRLPRVVGSKKALQMILSGDPIDAKSAVDVGLIDAIAQKALPKAGLNMARRVIANGSNIRRTRDRSEGFSDPMAYQKLITDARKLKLPVDPTVSNRIIDCVEAAQLLPFETGLDFERVAFEDCKASRYSKGLRHAFSVERSATKMPARSGSALRIKKLAVVGAGLMGQGIARAALMSGFAVVLIDTNQDTIRSAMQNLKAGLDREGERGRINDSQKQQLAANIQFAADLTLLKDCQFAIEAVTEDFEAKKEVLIKMEAHLADGAVLATNTSYLDPNLLAAELVDPTALIGMHFFSPAHVMPLVELAALDQSSDRAVLTGYGVAKLMRKSPVSVGVTPGYVGNRILKAYRYAADFAVLLGAEPAQVDAAMRDFGFAMGPYQVLDMAGLDISWSQRKASKPDPKILYCDLGDRLCQAGHFGQKTGRGYYVYADGKADPNPDLTKHVAAARAAVDIEAGPIRSSEISKLCLMAMANEGARLIDEGVASGIDVVDAVMLLGYGFPRHRGGPMLSAELFGVTRIVADLKALADGNPFWEPATFLINAVKSGQVFPR